MSVPTVQPSCSTYRFFGFGYPTISTGTGLPTSATEPDGSLYMRVDAPNASSALYVSVGGAWTPK